MAPHVLRVAQIVLGALLAVALLLAGLGALLPRHWRVEQSIMINAPPVAIHAWVNDLRHWSEWAQWNKSELAPRNQIGAPSIGAGATLTWYGKAERDADLTSGEVRIVRSDAALGVWFENRTRGGDPSRAQVTYVPQPGVTEVFWRDEGELPLIVGGLFLDLFQKRLSQHMEAGLARLKNLVELEGRVDPSLRAAPLDP